MWLRLTCPWKRAERGNNTKRLFLLYIFFVSFKHLFPRHRSHNPLTVYIRPHNGASYVTASSGELSEITIITKRNEKISPYVSVCVRLCVYRQVKRFSPFEWWHLPDRAARETHDDDIPRSWLRRVVA